MIVEDGQRHELAAVDLDGAFEVELPERVGHRAFKARSGLRRGRLDGNAIVTAKNVGDGADGRHLLGRQIAMLLEEIEVNLAWPPVEAVTHAENPLLDVAGGACRGATRPA